MKWHYVIDEFAPYHDTRWLTFAIWPNLAYPVYVLDVALPGTRVGALVQGANISVI